MAHVALPSQKSPRVPYLCPEGAAGAKLLAGVRVGSEERGRGVGTDVGVDVGVDIGHGV